MDERAGRRVDGRDGREATDDRGWWGTDDLIVASGDRHDLRVEFLCVGEAA
ncbi:MAG TPA: hypothetical protein VHB02_08845 [Acidimicrobiales bacterium]|nr:hypothetical protein [Acidimicrobiales bacterium]